MPRVANGRATRHPSGEPPKLLISPHIGINVPSGCWSVKYLPDNIVFLLSYFSDEICKTCPGKDHSMQKQGTLLKSPVAAAYPTLVETYLHIQKDAAVETAEKGRTLIHEDDFADHSMLLLDGWVAFSKMLPDGEIQIIDVMLPGDFALIGAVNAPVAACTIEALSDVRFIKILPAQANGPEVEMEQLRSLFAGEIVRMQARTSELLLRMGKGNAASRVAYALLEFHVRLEAIDLSKDGYFEFPMNQHKLGEFTGLSNVHVCRTLRRFEREGIISHPTYTAIQLNDLDALCMLAGINLDAFRHEILIKRSK
ncbi:Crp/Fnr family transcriptional regulator [Sulfitobacter sp. F26169L]|uniref:Crp/Fnr family transcriptional regulator n=1 Tax=Sulfitobacter sp. F26169L TaxID=2996015 RepID=UPI0022608991|nr:Crp/Fnr family transcriptional regulator [Sulfitobacter sp. F26169L]MCX7568230.1 Crp/Fnr family transcriptional regulator [Sulfitobacter sp. F26169L]